jgi:small-conductance mechanosensitive channel
MALAVTLPPTGPDDLEKSEEVIRGAVEPINGVLREPPPRVILSHAGQDKVELKVVFWVPAHDVEAARGTLSQAVDQVRTALGQADVSVADTTAVPA